MQELRWATEPSGDRRALILDQQHTTPQQHRGSSVRALITGLVVIAVLARLTNLELDYLVVAGMFIAVLLHNVRGGRHLWYRRLTLRGSMLELSWSRLDGQLGVPDLDEEALLNRRRTWYLLLLPSPPPIRIPLADVEHLDMSSDTLTIRTLEHSHEVQCDTLTPLSRQALLTYLRDITERARAQRKRVSDGDRQALQQLSRME